MTRLERLLSIALLLSARRRLRAEDLSEEFRVSLRTVYRDIRSLQETGFPIVGAAGDGYRLPPTTQLRPLAFDPAEAVALVMGARLLDSLVDSPLKGRLQSAIAKLEAVLTPEAIQRVAKIRDHLFIEPRARATGPLTVLLEAVNNRKVMAITYDGIARGERTRREIEPIGLVRYANVWLVPAYCRLRQDLRVFRADRIVETKLTEEEFKPRPGLTLQDYIKRCEEEVCASPSKTS
ncbi:MAG: WYL domain-containing protein [Nitrospirae bacterium]|nr:WYL domain-containing protein [Nitrospirota bacterium]